jgi:inner membrane protein
MIAPTHVTFAELLYLLLLTALGVPLGAAHAAAVAVASVLPDVDTPTSAVGRLLPALSTRLERTYGHRTVTHSLLGMAALALVAVPLLAFGRDLYLCFVAGYVSHPLLDTMTVTGVPLFHPFSAVRCVFPFDAARPRRYRIVTGSHADRSLAALFAAVCVPLAVVAHQGYERVIRVAQADVAAAVRDYNAFAGTHLVKASVDGAEALSKRPVHATYPVVGALDARTLLVRGADGDLHTVGEEFQSEIVAERVVCARLGPAAWDVRTVDFAGRMIVQLSDEVPQGTDTYLFGSLVLDGEIALPSDPRIFRPVSTRGEVLTLNFATARDLERLGLGDRIVVQGLLTVRSLASAGRPPGAGPRDRFVHRAFAVAESESIEVLVRPGDTVEDGTVMARRWSASGPDEQLALAVAASVIEERERSRAERSAAARITAAESTVADDSLRLEASRQLVAGGYLAGPALEPLAAALTRTRGALARARAAAVRDAERGRLQRMRRSAQIAKLRAGAGRGRAHPSLRSDIRGIVVYLRSESRGAKKELRVTIREGGTR